jgi:hypothetical protein
MPASKRVADWIDRALWAGIAAVCVFIAKQTGLL